MADAILYLANNPMTRTEMGDRARSYALAHWSHDKVLGDFEKEILSLTEK